MKKALAVMWLGAILLSAGGCSQDQSAPAPTPTPRTPEPAEATPLELPMYEVIDQQDMKVPTAKLGEEIKVGPVTVKVTLDGLTYTRAGRLNADGRVVYDDTHIIGYYGFRVEIQNNSTTVLDLNPRNTLWIASDSQLKSGPLSPVVNWFIIGRRPDGGHLLVLPDPEIMEELGYQREDVNVANWAKNILGLHPLPSEIGPNQSANGYIIFSYPSTEQALKGLADPDDRYYLFFGNWPQGRAWGRFDLGTLPELLKQLMNQVGPNPPRIRYIERK